MMRLDEPIKVAFVALGCAKNLVDSEKMLGQLAEGGVLLTSEQEEADVIVVNTCGFLQAARQEAHQAIAEAVAMKRRGCCRRVVVAGCLVQRDGVKLLEAVPGIDALVGVHRRDDVLEAVLGKDGQNPPHKKGKSRKNPDLFLGDYYPYVAQDTARLRLTPPHYAYLRISEGCDQKCTFCTIPSIRGPMHSKPPEAVLTEARELIADGAIEINVIGQDTTGYGRDIGYERGLAGILRELNRLDGVRWIRLLYAYPLGFSDEIIAALAECERVVKYADIPLQHINDRLLKGMGRRVTREQTEQLLTQLRDRIPGIAIRTTLIAGFPGETDAEFEELHQFIHQQRFSALGVFPYSRELDTPSGQMKGQLPARVKEERTRCLMETQQAIAFADAAACAGRSMEVLIDQDNEDGTSIGRHPGQAPEVDAVTIVQTNVPPGQMIQTICQGSQGYDLLARPTDAILPVL